MRMKTLQEVAIVEMLHHVDLSGGLTLEAFPIFLLFHSLSAVQGHRQTSRISTLNWTTFSCFSIVQETNRYAWEKIANTQPLLEQSVWKSWEDVTVPEFKAFLGVLMNMALDPKPDIKEYFSQDILNKMPFFPSVFSRTKFLQIFWMLHPRLSKFSNPTNMRQQGQKHCEVHRHKMQRAFQGWIKDLC